MMHEEPRVCVVLYKRMGDHVRYAVLRRTLNWEGWELLKGHIEEEDAETAAIREIEEETGITDIIDSTPIDYTMEWSYEDDGETVNAVCDCFLVQVAEDAFINVDANPHDEHETGHFLNYRDAYDILTYDNQKELLKHAKEQLEEQ